MEQCWAACFIELGGLWPEALYRAPFRFVLFSKITPLQLLGHPSFINKEKITPAAQINFYLFFQQSKRRGLGCFAACCSAAITNNSGIKKIYLFMEEASGARGPHNPTFLFFLGAGLI